jgi:hypothetical protein
MIKRVIAALLIAALVLFLPVWPSLAGNTLTLTVATNEPTYSLGDTAYVSGNLMWTPVDAPVTQGIVGVEVTKPSGQPLILRTLPTGSIPSQNWLVNFTAFYPCDSNGNPEYSFQAGEAVYVYAAWKNFDKTFAHTVLCAVTVYGANSVPLGYQLFTTSLAPYATEVVTEDMTMIPTSTVGNVTFYASLFSDLPENGGYPYCPEQNATFTIGTLTSNSPFESSSDGFYNFSFTLPSSGIPVGNYTVYATTPYGADAHATFTVILVGDILGDGVVDIYDAIALSKAFGSHCANYSYPGEPASPNWNPAADLNHDGIVDIYDALILAEHFGDSATS